MYGKGHPDELNAEQTEYLKDFIALRDAQEELAVERHNRMFGGK